VERIYDIGVPARIVARNLRLVAEVLEARERYEREEEAAARHPRLVVVNPENEPPA